MDLEELVRLYFKAGYSYSLILRFLDGLHSIALSLRTLKRLLRRMGLRRHGSNSDVRLVAGCIQVCTVSFSGSIPVRVSMALVEKQL